MKNNKLDSNFVLINAIKKTVCISPKSGGLVALREKGGLIFSYNNINDRLKGEKIINRLTKKH